YLTPHPHRGERNEPKFTTHISQKIAELIDISDNDVKNLTTNNAIKLFNLPL
ncbi:MAG: hydrolase TatD, partial [Campylobacteraceae bacterium]|nr:hydrolase TatD [Campylobacteraceae bacterium]